VILETLDVDPAIVAASAGWTLEPEGACKGAVCVPLPDRTADDDLDVETLAARLGMPLLHDRDNGLGSRGPASVTGKALETAKVADDFALPDLDGNPFHLSSLHGKKVLLVAWASW
jgi:hypothetical protein